MEIISSVQNTFVKITTKLHTTKGRKEAGLFIVEGKRACADFIKNGFTPVYSFATETFTALPDSLQNLSVQLVTETVMKKMSTSTTPSGLLCVFEIPETPDPKGLSSGLVLANISDPGNMGTLIRSCAAFGFSTVVIVDGCDPYSSKVIQASAGSLAAVKLFQWSWQELLKNKKNLELIALVLDSKKTPQTITTKDNLFVIGNEAHGIAPDWIAQCNQTVTIPMPGKTESLNAAVAGSIALALFTLKN